MSEFLRDRFHDQGSRVRVTDVAKLARCAPATVSRALNNPEKVSPEKRERIESAMLELGYMRNSAARALRSQRTHMVGVLIPTLDFALYASLVNAANRCFSSAGISTLIATFDYDLEKELLEARLLLERGAEALILIGQNHKPKLYELLKKFDVPFINTYVMDHESRYPNVGFNNAKASASITRHLLQLGHRHMCVISGKTLDNDRTTSRLDGVRSELLKHGITLENNMIEECSYSIENGRIACATLLSRLRPRPTAIICGNDVLALGAMVECHSRDLVVPDDISIVGFDNFELSKHSKPALTTINVPAEEMGENAAKYLLNALEGNEVVSHLTVEAQFILRDSTAPPKSTEVNKKGLC